MYDVVIKNGYLIDDKGQRIKNSTLCIKDGSIVKADDKEINEPPVREIDAGDCLILPGLIDAHIHVYHGGGSYNLNVSPDIACIPNGVTTCCDPGSAGPFTFESLYSDDIVHAVTTIKAMLHMSFNGVMPAGWDEIEDPKSFDAKMIKRLWMKYADTLIGLKIRMTDRSTSGMGLSPLQATIDMAKRLEDISGRKCIVTTHVSDLCDDVEMEDLINLMRPGDVFTHLYQNSGTKTLLDADDKVKECFYEGKEKGIFFDSGTATGMFSVHNILTAMEQGMYPDIFGSDIVGFNFYKAPCMTLPYTLSMFMNMGMPLQDIIKACTKTVAGAYGLVGVDTLDIGTKADISLFQIVDHKMIYKDKFGGTFEGEKLLLPMATIKDGVIVYLNTTLS